MNIEESVLDQLSAQDKANPRLRQAYDLRTTPEDNSQRILNAMEPGTILPIHRHRGSTETVVVLRGNQMHGIRHSNTGVQGWEVKMELGNYGFRDLRN